MSQRQSRYLTVDVDGIPVRVFRQSYENDPEAVEDLVRQTRAASAPGGLSLAGSGAPAEVHQSVTSPAVEVSGPDEAPGSDVDPSEEETA